MTDVTFGVALRGSVSLDAFGEAVRRADALGCDVIAAPDHLGAPDPFTTLTAAAGISARVRLRTYVLNVGFWNPALLARVAATADLLSHGRLELGLGAGHIPSEHQDAGLPWFDHRTRVEQLEATLVEVRRRLNDPEHRPRPTQPRIPIVVGAMSSPGLQVAARHADVIAFSGLLPVRGAPAGTFTLASAQQTRARVVEVRRVAAGRAYRSDALLQAIVIGKDPAAAAARLAEPFETVSAEQTLGCSRARQRKASARRASWVRLSGNVDCDGQSADRASCGGMRPLPGLGRRRSRPIAEVASSRGKPRDCPAS